jgi:hypothetical protein
MFQFVLAKIGPATEIRVADLWIQEQGQLIHQEQQFQVIKFHDTKGNIEVNGAGQLQFTLPIALPPGIKV